MTVNISARLIFRPLAKLFNLLGVCSSSFGGNHKAEEKYLRLHEVTLHQPVLNSMASSNGENMA